MQSQPLALALQKEISSKENHTGSLSNSEVTKDSKKGIDLEIKRNFHRQAKLKLAQSEPVARIMQAVPVVIHC